MNRFTLLLLLLPLSVFGQVPPTKAVKLNSDDTYNTPTATELWTANPLPATFITQTPSALLSNEQALSSMSTGIVGVTTGTGMLNSFSDSAGLRAALSDETGTGALVFANTPTLVTPILGAATATSVNGLTISTTTGAFTLASGKTLTASNTLTLTGTDSSTVNFAAGGTVGYVGSPLSQFASTTSAQLAGVISNETGSGALVFGTSPALTTPDIGVATATSVNGLAIDSSTGTLDIADGKTLGVLNSLSLTGTDSSSINFGAGGTVAYTGGTLAQFSNTTSAQLAGILTNETGSGFAVFSVSPLLVTPALGVATATSINGLGITTTTGTLTMTNGKTLSVANTLSFSGTDLASIAFGTGGTVAYTGGTLSQFASTSSSQLASVLSDETGTGLAVFGTSPTLTTPVLGVATATSINGLLISSTTGTLTVSNGKTLTASNTLAFSGTDGSLLNIGTGGTLGTLAFASSVSAGNGGTGISSYAVGDLLTANGTSSLTRIAAVATGNALISGGIATAPTWGKITTSHTTGIAASGANADITSMTPSGGTLAVTGAVTSTVAGSTISTPGTVELATTTEAAAMVDTARAVTPEGVSSALNATRAVDLTGDDTALVIGTERVILMTSDNATATNRSFTLSSLGTAPIGHQLKIVWSDVTDRGEFTKGIGAPIKGTWSPGYGDIISLVRTASGWVEIHRSNDLTKLSSSEQVIGTWVDDTTLYRKTIDVGTLPNTTTSNDAHGISGGSFGGSSIKRVYGYCSNGTTTLPIPNASSSATTNIGVLVTTTNITIGTNADLTTYSGYVTLEYTK